MSRAAKEQTWKQWVREVMRAKKDNPAHPTKLYSGCMAGLTGTDYRVLEAFVPILKLYSYTGERRVLAAASAVLREMQPKELWIARELIPFAMCWEDRERLWPLLAEEDRLAAIGRSYAAEIEAEDAIHVEDHG